MKIGILKISLDPLINDGFALNRLFEDLGFVCEAKQEDFYTRAIMYKGICPQFDDVPEDRGAKIPVYQIQITTSESGEISKPKVVKE
jgi:hypothetical protein